MIRIVHLKKILEKTRFWKNKILRTEGMKVIKGTSSVIRIVHLV